jgi:hypothetical protein
MGLRGKPATTGLLRQPLKDKMLTKTLFDISKSEPDCFKKGECQVAIMPFF